MIRRQGRGGSTLLQRLQDVWKVWEEIIFIGSHAKTPTVHDIWQPEEPLQQIPQLHTKSWLKKKFISASVMNPARCLCAVAPWEQHWPTLVSFLPSARLLIGDSPLVARFQDIFAPQANSSVCLRTGLDTEKFYCGAAKQRRINPGCSLPLSAISQPLQSTWLNQLQWLRAARFFYKPGGRRKRREGRPKSEAHQPTLLNTQVIIIYSTKPLRNICLKLTFLVS